MNAPTFTLRNALEERASAWQQLMPTGERLAIPEELVLQHGRAYEAQPLPERYRRDVPKYCYHNAQTLAARSRGKLRYVEGYAMRADLGIPMQHAWCIDEQDRVVDPTWIDPEKAEYFGVPFDMATVRKNRTRYDLSVLHTLIPQVTPPREETP